MNEILVLSETNPDEWGSRALGDSGSTRVCASLDELVAQMARERPEVAVVEFPVGTLSDSQVVERLMTEPGGDAMRLVVIGGRPGSMALAQRAYPGLLTVAGDSKEEALRAAIGGGTGALTGQAGVTWDLNGTKVALRLLSDQGPATRAAVLIAWVTALKGLPGELSDCLESLRYLAPRVRSVVQGVPQTLHAVRQQAGRSQSVVARLVNAWVPVLDNILREVDRGSLSPSERHYTRCWLVNQEVRSLEFVIQTHVFWGAALPDGTWMRLHDQHHYIHSRLLAEQSATGDRRTGTVLWDIRHSYVRALLWGCCGLKLAPPAVHGSKVLEKIGRWARRTALREASTQGWRMGTWVVDMLTDSGPSLPRGRYEVSSRAYVLVLPTEFQAFIAGHQGVESPRPGPVRTQGKGQ